MNYDKWCLRCANHTFETERGVICKLTGSKPDFVEQCPEYRYDANYNQQVRNRRIGLKRQDNRHRRHAVGLIIFGFAATTLTVFALPLLAIGVATMVIGIYSLRQHKIRQERLIAADLSDPAHAFIKKLGPELLDTSTALNTWELSFGRKSLYTKLQKWTREQNYAKLFNAYRLGNYEIRLEVVKQLRELPTRPAQALLMLAMKDAARPIVQEAIAVLQEQEIRDEGVLTEIKRISERWDVEERRVRDNWSELTHHDSNGLYLDKSQMVQLKALKKILGKFKSSMSIG